MRYAPQSLRQRRGFTLIEMLIVAALITIFSTIAIFSMQQLMESFAPQGRHRRPSHRGPTRCRPPISTSACSPRSGIWAMAKLSEDPIMGIDRSSGTDMLLAPGFSTPMVPTRAAPPPWPGACSPSGRGPYLPNTNPRSVPQLLAQRLHGQDAHPQPQLGRG